MNLTLKGVFSRSRRDFQVEKCMYGGSHANNTNQAQVRVSLFNNSATGNTLAVYGIMAWLSSYPQIVNVGTFYNQQDAGNELQAPVKADGPVLDGVVVSSQGITITAQGTMRIAATGDKWLTLGEAPMFILPPKWSLSVWTITGISTLYASFLWSYY